VKLIIHLTNQIYRQNIYLVYSYYTVILTKRNIKKRDLLLFYD